ncbi:DUF2380 domain-containing protein [Thermodesulfobacteriota bacterium]
MPPSRHYRVRRRWNNIWKAFFEANPNPTQKDIYGQAGKMIYDFRLDELGLEIIKYKGVK